ncbi:hypothetical protein [Fulvimonas yonginensis]|uniref:Uncharacterized protein n=1 Tax=Fulvimonas yonginensis TaxID=1495200 RepID=A0ABU8JC90_9GAMM
MLAPHRHPTRRTLRRLLLLLALLALAACHSRDQATGGDRIESPEATVRQSLALLREGDFDGFWRHALPPPDYAMLRDDWHLAHGDAPLSNATEPTPIDATLRQLHAPDAEEAIDAQLQPWLANTQARYGDQLPLLVGIGRAIVDRAVANEPRLSEAQKRDATALVQALVPWAQQAPWFDPDRARRAVRIAVATAGEPELRDADGLHPPDFAQAMRRYAVAFAGFKRILALYGLSVDQVLASAHVVPLDYHPPYARVRIEYEVLGTPLSVEASLVLQNGRWYDQDLVESVRRSHRELAAPAATASAATVATDD